MLKYPHTVLHKRSIVAISRAGLASLSHIDQAEKEVLFGPRVLYDAAHREHKSSRHRNVGKDLLLIEFNVDRLVAEAGITSDDLFIISKILRRIPGADRELRSRRLNLARLICHESARLNNVDATLFWTEETMSSAEYLRVDGMETHTRLIQLAAKGIAKANYQLGLLYAAGKKPGKGAHYYRLAGEQGYAPGFTALGNVYRARGDREQAEMSYKLASDKGDPEGDFYLALYVTEQHVRLHHLQKAMKSGSPAVAHNLGEELRKAGRLNVAMEYYEVAARKGFQISQVNLAAMHELKGEFAKAEAWYKAAINAGGKVGSLAEGSLKAMWNSKAYKDRSANSPAVKHEDSKNQESGWCTVM